MAFAMLSFFRKQMINATLTSFSGEAIVEGERVKGAGVPTPIKIIPPQPLKSNELRILGEGESAEDYLKTYTEADVNTRRGSNEADHITWSGAGTYKVMKLSDRGLEGSFKVVFMKKVIE